MVSVPRQLSRSFHRAVGLRAPAVAPTLSSNSPPSLTLKQGPVDNTQNDAPKKPSRPTDVTDREWEIRTGRAISILRGTLPDFFSIGLVTRPDDGPTPIFDYPPSIYANNVRLTYTPPHLSLPLLHKVAQIEGLPLYSISAAVVRHTMMAFYHDLRLEMTKINVISEGTREKKASVAFKVHGKGRVSGADSQWAVKSTYSFSPCSGLICQHVVESIQPAPHITVYETLMASLRALNAGEHPAIARECPRTAEVRDQIHPP